MGDLESKHNCFKDTTFQVRIPNFRNPKFQLPITSSNFICTNDHLFEWVFVRHVELIHFRPIQLSNIPQYLEPTIFLTFLISNKLIGSNIGTYIFKPDRTQLGCSFLVTNIPLGAYLLGLGAHFEPS
jgi:hypothetical protein